MTQPKIVVFAGGGKEPNSGGSGFANLVKASFGGANGPADIDITHVVSNHASGGVSDKARSLGVKFIHFPKPWSAEGYLKIVEETRADLFVCSGWLKKVTGLNPARTINIHPGPLPKTAGLYGKGVHQAVMEAFSRGELTETEVTMHFVTSEYDKGPPFFRLRIPIQEGDTAKTLQKRVLACEHSWQPRMTAIVAHGRIRWDGTNPDSLEVPPGYRILR